MSVLLQPVAFLDWECTYGPLARKAKNARFGSISRKRSPNLTFFDSSSSSKAPKAMGPHFTVSGPLEPSSCQPRRQSSPFLENFIINVLCFLGPIACLLRHACMPPHTPRCLRQHLVTRREQRKLKDWCSLLSRTHKPAAKSICSQIITRN